MYLHNTTSFSSVSADPWSPILPKRISSRLVVRRRSLSRSSMVSKASLCVRLHSKLLSTEQVTHGMFELRLFRPDEGGH